MENQFTPGPWHYCDDLPDSVIGYRAIIDADGFTVCSPSPMGAANARLISAAPDLLACLLDVLDADGDLYAMDFDRYRAAIAKATGVQP